MSTEYFMLQKHNNILLSSPYNFLQSRPCLRAIAILNKCKKIEIIPCILSDHNAIKLAINNKNAAENMQRIEG
jgi:hypothetical protein